MANTIGVDHQPGILAGDNAGHADIAGSLVDGHVGNPGRPRGAIPWKFTVHVKSVGKPPAAQDVPLSYRLLPAWTRRPARPLSNGVDEIDAARISEIAKTIFDRIDAGFGRQFIDIGFMSKGVR